MENYDLKELSTNMLNDWSVSVPFRRTAGLPIDKYSLFFSLKDAEDYAKGLYVDPSTGVEADVSYPGQIINVLDKENNSIQTYVIQLDRTLKQIESNSTANLTNISAESISVDFRYFINSAEDIKLSDKFADLQDTSIILLAARINDIISLADLNYDFRINKSSDRLGALIDVTNFICDEARINHLLDDPTFGDVAEKLNEIIHILNIKYSAKPLDTILIDIDKKIDLVVDYIDIVDSNVNEISSLAIQISNDVSVSISTLSSNINKKIWIEDKTDANDICCFSDLSIIRMTKEEYDDLLRFDGEICSNVLYNIVSENLDAGNSSIDNVKMTKFDEIGEAVNDKYLEHRLQMLSNVFSSMYNSLSDITPDTSTQQLNTTVVNICSVLINIKNLLSVFG